MSRLFAISTKYLLLGPIPFLLFLVTADSAEINAHGTNQQTAVTLSVNDFPKTFKFNYAGDENWFVFYGVKNQIYDIQIPNRSVGKGINPLLELYNTQGELIRSHDTGYSGEGELLSRPTITENGYYFLRVRNLTKTFSPDARFAIQVFLPLAPNNLLVKGRIIDKCIQRGINEAIVESGSDATLSYKTGEYALSFPAGTYTLTVQSRGYAQQSQSVTLKNDDLEAYVVQNLNFELSPIAGCPAKQPLVDNTQIQQQASGIYNDKIGELRLKDVRFGDQPPISVTLQDQGNFIFKLIEINKLNEHPSINFPAFYDYDNSLVDVPSVFAFGMKFHITIKNIDTSANLFELR